MPRFVGQLISRAPIALDSVPGEARWTVRANYRLAINNRVVVIPKGFPTDLASIPRFVRFWLDDDDPDLRIPGVIHDFLYSRNGVVMPPGMAQPDREDCDDLLVQFMRWCGTNRRRESAVFLGVRLGGWKAWRGYAKQIRERRAAAWIAYEKLRAAPPPAFDSDRLA